MACLVVINIDLFVTARNKYIVEANTGICVIKKNIFKQSTVIANLTSLSIFMSLKRSRLFFINV
jgi:hypothetical protein